ncbi:protein Niban 2a [Misgurnus anguillicaudatus]|uniref:protein Niban 2a n=1 Tax=Misgurnus anguillicaudatus TaxID=75329 RepID=UPI003CCF4774
MGDVISSNLDEGKREMITAHTRAVMKEFGKVYEEQYAVALFNSVRFEIEGGGTPQTQLLHRKDPLKNKSIFSGGLFNYLEESKKWRSRFLYVGDTYNISLYESKAAYDRGIQSKGTINCAGYRALTSMEEYLGLLNNSPSDAKAKGGTAQFLKCPTQYPLILWHPYARHHYFCVMTEKEQQKWHAVFQDCVRHTNNGLSEECKVATPAFTDALRLYRQAKGHYGTWDMMCGNQAQILANLVMETLQPELKNMIVPRLKGKPQQRQKDWMLISDAVYRQVLLQTRSQHEALVQSCEVQHPRLDAALRTDMDQIITSKEHVTGKIRAFVLPRANQLLSSSVQPYINSILEALMEPTSRGFAEVREILFRELVEVSKNVMNDSSKEKLVEHMEKISMLAFHPVKMQSCYEKMEMLNLEGLQQRFDVSSPSVFIQRAQILMRQQMDNGVYTFEQLVHQSLQEHSGEDLCKTIQRCQDRVLKKYDYDSSSVRKKFFREALLQIIIPYMLKQLSPSCSPDLPKFKELIFEDFSRFILVENIYEEVVLQSITKDIMMAVKEAAVQRRHNLYRDSVVLTNSDPNLHLLGEDAIDWAGQIEGAKEGEKQGGEAAKRRRKQIVSMIHLEGMPPLPYESCQEVPGVDNIPEEKEGWEKLESQKLEESKLEASKSEPPESEPSEVESSKLEPLELESLKSEPPKPESPKPEGQVAVKTDPGSPDSIGQIRHLINPVLEVVGLASEEDKSQLTNGVFPLEECDEVKHVVTVTETVQRQSPIGKGLIDETKDETHAEVDGRSDAAGKDQTSDTDLSEDQQAVSAIESAIQQIVNAVREDSDDEFPQSSSTNSSPNHHDDSGFQSPANENVEGEPQPITVDAEQVTLTLVEEAKTPPC